jgi:tetratricopeptide (TPR) repeat protein
MAGDDMTAERLYREALRSEPRNVDVLLGLVAVTARQGRVDEAQQHYMHVLDLEPRSAAAYAGLIGVVGQADPAGSASRLKSLLAQQPDAAFLHEALGNLYAEQGQWPTAQQSYSQAYLLDPSSAEYAFNLAVSLDQLNETKLALSYYQRAQELQSSRAGVLDKDQLETRISQLRQSLNQ